MQLSACDSMATALAEHEINRVGGDPAQLGLVIEGALEHGKAARHRDDVQRGGGRIAAELAALGTSRHCAWPVAPA